jgi:glycosyltransferase involved in cell wall biosynthesis
MAVSATSIPPSPKPLLSVVIPTLNNARTLTQTLRSLEGAVKAGEAEVIVADGGSTDGTPDIAVGFGARLIPSSDKSSARNAGARAARGAFLLFIDSDMEASPSLVRESIQRLGECDAAAIREVVLTDNYWGRTRALEKECFFRSTTWEAARLFRREVFLEIGGYDVRLGSSFEDMDLQFRLQAHGAKVSWVEAPVYHHEEGMGLLNYIHKRRVLPLGQFIKSHPVEWRAFYAPRARVRRILGHIKSTGRLSDITLLPGLVILRGAELLARAG